MAASNPQFSKALADARRRVWVLVDGRSGDDAQILRIAAALGWPSREVSAKRSVWETVKGRAADAFGTWPPTPSMLPADAPPWPDLLLASGGRNVSFARRIKVASGGKTRIVFLGAPIARLDDFDLIVTTAQWRLPARPNVVHNLLPLNWPTAEALAEAGARWRPKLENLPRPWLGVSVGGTSSSYALTVADAHRLAQMIVAQCQSTGGAALVTTSRRTPTAAADALAAGLTTPHTLYRWRPGDDENPYLGFLALADRFLVTNETASMISDALHAGKPVDLFSLTQRPVSRFLTHPRIVGRDGPDATQYAGAGRGDRFRRWLIDRGFWTPARNMPRLQRMLGAAGLLGDRDGRKGGPLAAAPVEDLARTIAAIHALFPRADESDALDSN